VSLSFPIVNRSISIFILICVFAAACTGSDDPTAVPEERAPIEESEKLACHGIDEQIARARRGWVPYRGQDIALIPREPNYIGFAAQPVHTGPWDYLAEVPLVMYGPGALPATGDVEGTVTLADLAPTYARLADYEEFLDRELDGRPLDVNVDRPALIVTMVWDGGGINTLSAHPDAWPLLKRAMKRGVSFVDAEIGSTPSNTPPVHTTLGTGVFPRRHGIPAVKMRATPEFIDPYLGNNADRVRVPSFADVYDRSTGNRAKIGLVATVNWHLGMIGHGSHFPGGDSDQVTLLNDAAMTFGDATAYELVQPSGASIEDETSRLDSRDGQADGMWRGHDLADAAVRYSSPAWVAYQAQVLGNFIDSYEYGDDSVTDLVFTNFKSVDDAGHKWGMDSEEVGEVVKATDEAFGSLIAKLDDTVGPGRWVVVVTADHGQTPYPEDSGAWPIGGGELRRDANRDLHSQDDGNDLVTQVTSAGAFVDPAQMKATGVTLVEIARWVADYRVGENLKEGDTLPDRFVGRSDEPLFDAAVVRDGKAVISCKR
jgi:hypothetical protein